MSSHTARVGLLLLSAHLLASPKPATQAVVIFADVTGSLSASQFNNVQAQFQTLVHRLPRSVTIEAYTITENAGFDTPVFAGHGLAGASTSELTRGASDLTKSVGVLNDRYKARKTGNEQQTCILNSVEFLCQHLNKLKVSHQRITVLYLSDMLEDCADTPAGVPIIMRKQNRDFHVQQSLLAKIPHNAVCLNGCEINAVLPGEFTQASIPGLTEFWRTALSIYGFSGAHVFTLLRNELPGSLPIVTGQ